MMARNLVTLSENDRDVMTAAMRSYIMVCGKNVSAAKEATDCQASRDAKFWQARQDAAFGIYQRVATAR